jgi:HSP20 family molecular chaperone IbpA
MSKKTTNENPSTQRSPVRPRTDVFETPEALVLVADVPGADERSVELELTDEILTLRAAPALGAPEGWQAEGPELELPAYERSFRIAADVERDSIGASLQVVLKKRVPRSNRIEVRSA